MVARVCREAGLRRQALTLTTFRDVPWYARLGFRALRPDELSPPLRKRVDQETAHGLPPALRVAMLFQGGVAGPSR